MKQTKRKSGSHSMPSVDDKYRHAFDNAPTATVLLNQDAEIIKANLAFQCLFFPDTPMQSGMSFSELIEADERSCFSSEYRQLAAGEIDKLDRKLICQSPDGRAIQIVTKISQTQNDDGQFQFAIAQVQDITEAANLMVQLEYQASYDELTGLLNRRAFTAELERAWTNCEKGGKPCFLMFMDLDQFKVVNDTSGHQAGDQLLKAISEVLLDSVRTNDTVARQGGDEFAILLWDCPADVAAGIAESIRASIEKFQFHWDRETYRLGISIGGISVDPGLGDINELQQLADAACYAAKESGRNQVHIVAGEKDSARKHRGQVRWVQRLREAMSNNRFAIYGHNIVPLNKDANEPERIEILLRLRDPDTKKMIPPGAFLPATERYGLSVELDQWVVTNLLHALYIHHAFEAEERQYWINLSSSSICDQRFAKFLREAIERSGLPPSTINFEISETAAVRSVSDATNLMHDLQEMGCQFALDDFGSGVSSYHTIKKLPIDFIKIDGGYVREILRDDTDRIFVKSIIDIGRSLNVRIIAESVESEEIMEMVKDLGADYAQGFAVSRPFVFAPKFPRLAEQSNFSAPATVNAN